MRKGFLKLAWEMFASCQVPSKAGEKKKAGETELLEKGGWGWVWGPRPSRWRVLVAELLRKTRLISWHCPLSFSKISLKCIFNHTNNT